MGQDVSAEKTEADITTKEVSSAIHYENIQMADGTRIDVDIPAGALPEGTDMRIFGVDLSENIQDAEKAAKAQRVLAALEKAVGQKLDQDQIAAYDMYFCEEEVSEDIHIQPEYPVTLTFKDVRVAGESAMVFHIPDDYNKNAELVSGTDLNPGGTVAIGENGTVTVTVEKAKEFSVYAIVGVKDAEEETEAVTEESTEAESETVFEEEKDIVDFGMFTFEDGSSVHVTTEQGVFPEGTQLKVTQVDRQLALQNAIKATGNENLTEDDIAAYDYDFFLGEEHDLEPNGVVKTEYANLAVTIAEELQAYHLDNNGELTSELDIVNQENTGKEWTAVEVQSDVFSVQLFVATGAGTNNPDDNFVEINKFSAQVRSGGEWVGEDYVWTADHSNANHSYIFRLTYDISGTYEFDPGSIVMTIPKSILVDREGKPADYYEMSLPHADDKGLTDENQFVYYEDRDNIVITNRVEVPSGQSGYIEVAYFTSEKTFEYADYGMEGVKNPKGGSDPFYGSIKISQGKASDSATTDEIPVYINTTAKITSTEKRTPTFYKTWQDSWGEDVKPADADDWYYLVWEIRTFTEDPTQPYNFILEDSFKLVEGTQGDVVGYRMQGAGSTYTETGRVENLTSYYQYGRYDYVLTKHKKSDYDVIADRDGKYTLENEVTATVDPIDQVDEDTSAVSSKKWTFKKLVFERPTGHFYQWKFGYDFRAVYGTDYSSYRTVNSEMIRSFELGNLKGVTTSPIDNLYYYTYIHGWPYPWTVGDANNDEVIDDEDLDNPAAYGKNPVNWELTDNEIYLNGSTEKLTADDYEIYALQLDYDISVARFDEEKQSFVSQQHTFTNEDTVDVWVELNGSEKKKKAATYNGGNGEYTWYNPAYVKDTFGKALSLVSGVTGYKLTTSNAYYYTKLGAYPRVRLNNSDAMVKAAKDSEKLELKNYAQSRVTDASGKEISSFRRYGLEYIIGIKRDGHITKEVSGYKNDTINRLYTITWKTEAYEDYREDTKRKLVSQSSGRFYDLLPEGAEYKQNSLEVYADGEELLKGSYSLKVVDNYRDSGRTMLIIDIDVTADKYLFYYSTNHSWDSIKDFGTSVLNSVAYETGNEDIGDGQVSEAYDPTEHKMTEFELMSGLDPDCTNERFIYTETNHEIMALTSAALGLYKKVRAAKDEAYVYSTVTYPDADYTYKLRFATDAESTAKDLILFDSLENYVVAAGEKESAVSDWHGTLVSVDTSSARSLGIDPVVYYSTVEKLNIDLHHDLAESTIWTRTPPEDLSEVKAITIDLRKNGSGEDYVLPTDTAIECTVYMHSPKNLESDSTDPVTYNNIYLNQTVMDKEGTESETELIHQDYTQLYYRVKGDLWLKKVDSTNQNTVIPDVVFLLSGTSDYGTEVRERIKTNRAGEIFFEDIEKGVYELQEIESTDDYQLNTHVFSVEIRADGTVYVDGTLYEEGKKLTVEDPPRIHGDFEFYKRGLLDNGAKPYLEGVTFILEGESDYGNQISVTAVSGADGKTVFKNIELGTYTMTEIDTVDGYILSNIEYTVTCDADGNFIVRYTEDGEETILSQTEDGDLEIYNEPLHTLTIKKMDTKAVTKSEGLAGAKFTLKGISDYGTAVDLTSEETNDAGVTSFEGLESGSYALQEISAPAHYALDEEVHLVVINKDGTVEGLTDYTTYVEEAEGFEGYKAFENDRLYEGTITITKTWEGEDEDRPIPVVHLDTVDPKYGLPYATIDKAGWAKVYEIYKNDAVSFKKFEGAETEVPEDAAKIDDEKTKYSVYSWKAEDGTWYWWSDAEVVYLDSDISDMFSGCSTLASIDLNGLDTSKMVSMESMFDGCSNLETANLKNIDTSNVTNMSKMFYGCDALAKPDLSSFNTSKVTDMSYMFGGAYKDGGRNNALKALDLSSFDTSNVTTMESMFNYCDNLESIFVSNFDTSKVTNMKYMFVGCKALTGLDLSSFNTSSVTTMEGMFYGCENLPGLDLSSFDTSNVTTMKSMFYGCKAITALNLENFATSNVTTMENMFQDCFALGSSSGSLILSSFDTSCVTNMRSMFCRCSNLTELDLSSFDTSNVNNFQNMFRDCTVLEKIITSSHWYKDEKQLAPIITASIFSECKALPKYSAQGDYFKYARINGYNNQLEPDSSGIYTGYFTAAADLQPLTGLSEATICRQNKTAWSMICNASSFGKADEAPNLDDGKTYYRIDDYATSYPVYAWIEGNKAYWYSDADTVYLPRNCRELFNSSRCETIDLTGLDFSKVENMSNMFASSASLSTLVFPVDINTSNVTNMSGVFSGCSALTDLNLSNFNTSNVTNMSSMFNSCKALESLDLSSFNTSKVTNMSSMFNTCSALKSLDLNSFDTSKVTDMSYMFGGSLYGCSALESLNLSSFDTSNVTDMSFMFGAQTEGCAALKSLDLSNFNTSKVTSMKYMFSKCSGLTDLDLSNFNTSNVTSMKYMFSDCSSLKDLDLSKFDTSKVADMERMFSGCTLLNNLKITGFDTSNVTNMNCMFYKCGGLQELNLSSFNISNVTDMGSMFADCTGLTSLDLSSFVIFKPGVNMKNMFAVDDNNKSKLKTIYTSSHWDSGLGEGMFKNCDELISDYETKYSDIKISDQIMARVDGYNDDMVKDDDYIGRGYFTYKEIPEDANVTRMVTNSVIYEGDDPDNAYDQWIKNDDGTWTYRFHVFDEDAIYYAYETSAPGYSWTVNQANATKIDYREGSNDAKADITNTKTEEETGSLIISKIVDGDTATASDRKKEFTFTVEVKVPDEGDGETMVPIPDGVYGDMTFKDGIAEVMLSHGRTASATPLPAGATFTVTETATSEEFVTTATVNGEIVSDATVTGTIETGKLSKVAFTNTKQPTTGELSITKTVTDATAEDEWVAFNFTLTLTGDEETVGGTHLYGGYVFREIESAVEGKSQASATVQVKSGETVTVKELPKDVQYKVTEVYAEGYEMTASENTEGTISGGGTAEVSFTNKKLEEKTGGFALEKQVTGKATEDSFKFTVVLQGLKKKSTYILSDESTFTSTAAGTASVTVQLQSGQKIIFQGLPVGTKYTITEAASDYKASYKITNAAETGSIVSSSGTNTKANTALSTKTEVVEEGEDITVAFTNRPVTHKVYVSKTMAGRPGEFVKGAKLQVIDVTDGITVLYQWISDGENMQEIDLAAGTYILREAEVPDGYLKAEDMTFTVDSEGTITVDEAEVGYIEMQDAPTVIQVEKVDPQNNAVVGAVLAAYLEDDIDDPESDYGNPKEGATPVASWTTGNSSYTLRGKLAVGKTYVIVETVAPKGYAKAKNVKITVENTIDTQTVTMVDPPVLNVKVTKTWDDEENLGGLRPSSVTVHLYADGNPVPDGTDANAQKNVDGDIIDGVIQLKEGNDWTYQWINLPKYRTEGDEQVEIVYSVEEDTVKEYTTEITGKSKDEGHYEFEITNQCRSRTSVTVTKVWDDANNQDGLRPEELTVTLWSQTESETAKTQEESVTLNGENSWTAQWTDLPAYRGGKAITYTVTENAVEGYNNGQAAVATGSQETGFTFTNKHEPELITLSGTKTWNDKGNQDGVRPESITVYLYADGTLKDTKVVSGGSTAETWSYEWTDLPKYDNGKEITYTVTEKAISDYTTQISGWDITNTHTPGKTSVTVTKTWEDEEDQDGLRPEAVTIRLMDSTDADAPKLVDTIQLTAEDNWTYTWTNLDEKKLEGTPIQYTVEEEAVAGYRSETGGDAQNGYVITNTHEVEKIEISGTKTWEDENDQDGIRPDKILLKLYADGSYVEDEDRVVTGTGKEWTYSWSGLDKYRPGTKQKEEIVYSVKEYTVTGEDIEGYEATFGEFKEKRLDITNSHTPEETSIAVTKVWDDANNQDGLRPEELTVTLWSQTESETAKTQEESVTLNGENSWTAQWTDLPAYRGGKAITYTVTENAVEGYNNGQAAVATGSQETGFTFTNKHEPELITLSGTKTWNDKGNQDGVRPESITVYLYADGTLKDTKVVSGGSTAETWSYEWTDLPKYDNGKEITYTVTEKAISDYTTQISGWDITNTHTPGKTSVTVTKTWEDEEDQDGLRPEAVTIRLMDSTDADAPKLVDTIQLTAEDNWTYTWTNLDEKKLEGTPIQYTVEEEAVAGYRSETGGDAQNGYVITNIHKPETLNLTVSKVWKDDNNKHGVRPVSITIRLLADGSEVSQKILTEKSGWEATFSDLPKYSDGKEIKYTISEDAVQHYTSKIDGNVVTNTLDKTSLPRPGTPEEPSVKTGDETPIMPFAVAMIFSASVLAGAAVSYRRRKYSR